MCLQRTIKQMMLGVLVAIFLATPGVIADQCALGSEFVEGNWYCQAVTAIQYTNVGTAGTYQDVTNMASDGTCGFKSTSYSGPIAPLDEEISMHFRGPIQLKQFAVYTPTSGTAAGKRNIHGRNVPGHKHRHVHRKREVDQQIEKKDMVIATMNGQVVSWENDYTGQPAATSTNVETTATVTMQTTTTQVVAYAGWVTATIDGKVESWEYGVAQAPTAAAPVANPTQAVVAGGAPMAAGVPTSSATPQTAAKPAASSVPSTSGSQVQLDFQRIAYYDSESQTAQNVAFLANHGGAGSGVFDYKFGASSSYVDSTGTKGSATPQILGDVTIPSGSEIAVMLDQTCDDGDCGYVRPGAVAHHGFAGANKVFMVEFLMPDDGQHGGEYDLVNQPAIWGLNAKVFRTQQYGDCSCWHTGCGEFDMVEALNSGSMFLKSTLHADAPGGDSDYIVRPTNKTMKLAVVFNASSSSINIQVLDDDTEFTEDLAGATITEMCSESDENMVSHFAIAN